MNEQSEIKDTKPKRKGLDNSFRLFLIIPFVCILISLAIFILGLLELLFNISFTVYISTFVGMDICLLFAILAIVSRMYYKMFKRD